MFKGLRSRLRVQVGSDQVVRLICRACNAGAESFGVVRGLCMKVYV